MLSSPPPSSSTTTTYHMQLVRTIAIFRRARVIVGPHGAGFANMVFAPPGTAIVEYQMQSPNLCYLDLATNLDFGYFGFRVPGAGQTNAMRVDVPTVLRRVHEALGDRS
ncbi:hypothetical protein PAPYR_10060 [Paratrimastix pyriformis]|uniref:Glycosyltransferase 61 catalytic domain-containing protein n=1 Tax=Paratrimastix pyriformis TaxID=342808 RepID=A0ABQ8U6V2_9EUKA|nr:hypothetical protein PAPYR_10060 [Paratrimastix pyriformis]